MAPIVDGLEQQYGEQLAIKRINADRGDGPAIMRAYRLPGHPSLLFFNEEGEEVDRLVGPQNRTVIEDSLQNILLTSSHQ